MNKKASASVINRLPRYYRYLGELEAAGVDRISSKELSEKMNTTASQIRQDLNCFGGFGQQGYGYNVSFLKTSIGEILGLNEGYTAILVGAGNMGRTFAINTKFEARGFKLIGIFDSDPKKEGLAVGVHKVKPYSSIKSFIDEYKPQMAILAVPKSAAHQVAEELIGYGISAFLNFSYAELSQMAEGILVENVHLSDNLMRLSYKIVEREKEAERKNDKNKR